MKVLLIILRLVLLAGFFFGLFLTIRLESFWNLLLGPALMLVTVPLNNLLIAAGQGKPADFAVFLGEFRPVFALIIPVILLIFAIHGMLLVTRYGAPQYLFLYLFAGIPLFMILARAVRGEIAWHPMTLASAFSRLVTFQVSYLGLVLGTLFMGLVVGVM